jgi:homoprotocatechuate degradation regulator HpaR
MSKQMRKLPPYRASLAGLLLGAREAVMGPIRPILREAGVSEQQWRVLRVLDDMGPIDPTSLAEAALLHAPSLTRILRELEERALIDRAADPSDGRRSIVELSPAGRGLLRQTSSQTVRKLDEYIAQFGADRMKRLMNDLRALMDTISEDEKPKR